MSAIVLLSGGLDSCVLLAHAIANGRSCIAISFDYGQRHVIELESAKKIAAHYNVEHHIFSIERKIFQPAASSLTNFSLPVTLSTAYVPCRNLLFLAIVASFAESRNASEIYLGANAEDTINFPDCSQQFIKTLEQAIDLGSKSHTSIMCPLSSLSKKDIIALGYALHAPIELTWSCYQPTEDGKQCGQCPPCLCRRNLIRST